MAVSANRRVLNFRMIEGVTLGKWGLRVYRLKRTKKVQQIYRTKKVQQVDNADLILDLFEDLPELGEVRHHLLLLLELVARHENPAGAPVQVCRPGAEGESPPPPSPPPLEGVGNSAPRTAAAPAPGKVVVNTGAVSRLTSRGSVGAHRRCNSTLGSAGGTEAHGRCRSTLGSAGAD